MAPSRGGLASHRGTGSLFAASGLVNRRLRLAAELPVTPAWWLIAKVGGLAAVLAAAVLIMSADRGVPLLLVIFGTLVVSFY